LRLGVFGLQALSLHWVDPVGQLLKRLFTLLAGFCQRHVGERAEGKRLLLTVESVFHTPVFASAGQHQQSATVR